MLRERRDDCRSDFIALGAEDSNTVANNLFKSMGLDQPPCTKGFGEQFDEALRQIRKSTLHDQDFLYRDVISWCGYDPVVVFVNFFDFKQIEAIALRDLSLVLDDVWRPGAEDVDVFDATYSWLVQVNHEECLLAWRVPSK